MKTQSAVLIGLLLIFGLLLPNVSLAWDPASAFLGVFSVLSGLIFNILGTITGALLAMAVGIFNWVASPNFISLSYTGLDNPFIAVGWTLTRDLTNIFFVIAMIAIGLGTALRITGYQAQKALPDLIKIALLINFTPVILGLIVDSSNIVMNFFVQGGFAGANSFANFAFSQWSNVSSLAGGLKFWDPMASSAATAAAVGSFILIFFNLIASIIYLMFGLIFILRYVAIWTLVILSPFAFACSILPATKKVWSQWWTQFIQWSLIGTIASFFLYLGDHFIRIATSGSFLTSSMAEMGNAPGLAPIINSTLPYVIAIIFLFIGLISSLTFAPKGADAFIKAGQKTAQKVGTSASWATIKRTATAPRAAVKSAGAFIQAKRMGFATRDAFGEAGREVKRWVKPRAPGARRDATWLETGATAIKGIRGTVGDVAIRNAVIDIARSGAGVKTQKKGTKECPNCHRKIAANAKTCPNTVCGYSFE